MEIVEFAGGEPLMDPMHYKVLEALRPYGEHITVKYSTNLSKLKYGKFDALEAWKDIPDTTRFGEDGMMGRIMYKKRLIKVERYIDKHIYWYLNLTGDAFGFWRYGLSENYVI